MNDKKHGLKPGITLRSVAVLLACMVIMGVITQFAEVIESPRGGHGFAHQTISLYVVMVFGGLLLTLGGVYALTRRKLLQRSEMFCILFALLIAAPLMSTGLWHGIFRLSSTLPRTASFDKMDALSDKLWPHGPNLVPGALDAANKDNLVTQGNASWPMVDYDVNLETQAPIEAPLITFVNEKDDDYSSVRLQVPLKRDNKPVLITNEPYMLSVLVRGENLEPGAAYFCRVYYDDSPTFSEEIFADSSAPNKTYLHKTGFQRMGSFNLVVPTTVEDHIQVEFGLEGIGKASFKDMQLMSVGAIEYFLRGRRVVTETELSALPDAERESILAGASNVVVKPDHMWSWDGLCFVLNAYVPWKQWMPVVGAWGGFAVLLLAATFAMAIIMRRQWLDNERYPMPIARMTMRLIGEEEGTSPFSEIWRNRFMWLGFAFSFFWCMMKGWQFFNPELPNMYIGFSVKPYLSGPKWGQTWTDVYFSVVAIYLSIAIFMELNVLLSIVIGFLLFRLQFWFGYNYLAIGKSGGAWYGQPSFPFAPQQITTAYVIYGLLVLFFTRKYLWEVIKEIIYGRKKEPGKGSSTWSELCSYRTAFVVLVAVLVGLIIWARWTGISVKGSIFFFGLLMLFSLVAAKMRTECGVPHAGFFPHRFANILVLVSGMSFLGPQGVIFAIITTSVLTPILFTGTFFLLPGLQVELIEMGRRFKILRRHIVYTVIIGIACGVGIGGWTFLSAIYGTGGDYAGQQHMFRTDRQMFEPYTKEMTRLTNEMNRAAEGKTDGAGGVDPAVLFCAYSAGLTALITILRQLFAGFWFHPIGFILGMSSLGPAVWGSCLAAWVIRSITLKLGGAVTVRTKLLPFFFGVFMAAVSAHVVFLIINTILYFWAPDLLRQEGLF